VILLNIFAAFLYTKLNYYPLKMNNLFNQAFQLCLLSH